MPSSSYFWAPRFATGKFGVFLLTMGVFLMKTTIAFVSFERDLSMNSDSGITTVPRGSERIE